MLSSAIAGFVASAVLIIAIGAQNAFVLRQGLRREHVLPVVLTCALSDLALISAGIAGLGAAIEAQPVLLTVIRWAGAVFLLGYAAMALRRSLHPSTLAAGGAGGSVTTVLLTCLALTWLNPHVYLDTVLLLGSVAATHGDQRWSFAAGAMVGSVLWFVGLGYGARLLRPVFSRPAAWRVLDGVIAVVMTAIAVSLVVA